MAELPSTIATIGSSDQGSVAEFFVLLRSEQFGRHLAELVEALETASHPGAVWAKWIDVVVERTPREHLRVFDDRGTALTISAVCGTKIADPIL